MENGERLLWWIHSRSICQFMTRTRRTSVLWLRLCLWKEYKGPVELIPLMIQRPPGWDQVSSCIGWSIGQRMSSTVDKHSHSLWKYRHRVLEMLEVLVFCDLGWSLRPIILSIGWQPSASCCVSCRSQLWDRKRQMATC